MQRLLLLLLLGQAAYAQTTVSGRVTDSRGRALPGANVFLKGTYDGANADSTGIFRFRTTRRDTSTLVVTFVGYEPHTRKLTLTPPETVVSVRLEEVASELNTVVITAGAFEASDERKMTMLKPLDIVTTAGAQADITAAMNLLPGAQRVGEQEGLFVRGGSGLETKVVIDGMIVQNPFFSSLPDVQQRGRFQPFMFKGTSFSTGGYSAQYGQALSSVLLLNTVDKTNNNGLSLSLNLASAALSYDHAGEKASVSGSLYYGNLRPLFALVRQNVVWTREPEFTGSSLTYRLRPTRNGLLKFYGMYSGSHLGMVFRDPSAESNRTEIDQRNGNAFATSTYTDSWDEGRWLLSTGLSYSRNTDDMTFSGQDVGRFDERTQGRLVLTRLLPGNHSLLFGAEMHQLKLESAVGGTRYALRETYGASFVESDIYLSRKLAGRLGVRAEYSSLLGRLNLAPRLSLAYKTGAFSQVSLAAGRFYQTPDYRYLYRNTALNYEKADHLILNFQVIKNGRTFRIESFYKEYNQLVREFTARPGEEAGFDANPYRFPWGRTDNSGFGYAKGFDLFWRDQKTVKGLDYWVTYSFVDTRRLFSQYLEPATPTFASKHNLSVIGKRFFTKIQTSMGLTYTFTSGRPYYNPNHDRFLADRTPAVHNLSFSASHLTRLGGNLLVLYASVDNLLNTRNVFTYRFAPDAEGRPGKIRYAVGPQSYRSFFVGGMIMLSKKAKLNTNDL
ncbi:TonB-dependent receptor [Tellurirhabdus rosea]|uniref:TonB-dependent receptor n=1 Tax=Tellurirhabdus rosea TaxID=2674997 RepID=UPI00225B4269|nr:TonB-dependent receptor [Tellurirhabdus rosea]